MNFFTEENVEEIVSLISNTRLLLHLNQTEMANILGISRQTLCNIERKAELKQLKNYNINPLIYNFLNFLTITCKEIENKDYPEITKKQINLIKDRYLELLNKTEEIIKNTTIKYIQKGEIHHES